MTNTFFFTTALKMVLLPIFLLGQTTLFSQDNNKVLGASSDPVQKLERLYQLTDSTRGIDLLQSSIFTKEAQEIAEASGQKKLIAHANLLAGQTYIELSKYDSALYFLNTAELFFEENIDPIANGEVAYQKGVIALKKRDYDLAMTNHYNAMAVWEKTGYKLGLGKALVGISDVYSYQNEFDESIKYGNQGIAIFKELGEYRLQAMAESEMAYNYLFQGDPDRALEQVNLAFLLMENTLSKPLHLAKLYNTRGNILKNMDRYDEALLDYQKNLELSEKGKSSRGIMVGLATFGHIKLLKKDYSGALPFTLKAIEMMKESGDMVNLWENYMYLSDIYAGLGDFEKANQYTLAYAHEMERLYEQKFEQIGSELAQKYETGKREATIVLQQQQIDQQAIIQKLGIGIAVLMILFMLTLIYFFRKMKTTTGELKVRNNENELLLKEIHHRVKNNLQTISSLLSLQSESITDKSAFNAVQESKNRVASMALIHQKLYQGENLAAIEMRDYFETIGKAIKDSFGEKAKNISLEVEMSEIELDVDTAIPIGLITNELITNSLKHAFPNKQNGKILITLSEEKDGLLKLQIADNGKASKNESNVKKEKGFGSLLIQLLTTQLGGKLEKSTEAGTSTIIEFSIQEKSAA